MEETPGIISVIGQNKPRRYEEQLQFVERFDIKQRESCPELSTDRLLRHSGKILLDNYYWK